MKRFLIFTVALVFLSLSFANTAPQSAHDLFQKALAAERGEGNLEKAIALYQRVVKEAKDDSLAAKAQLQIGMCYEKLGQEKLKMALEAFQKVIENYPDQQEIVKDARKRLASLVSLSKGAGRKTEAVESAGMTFKRIDIDEIERTHQAVLSPDGTKVLYIHVQERKPQYSIRVMELASGKSKTLVEGIDFGMFIIFRWSPDGKKVVYRNKERGLSVIDSDGGTPEVLWSSPDKDTAIYPEDWSFDNRHILAFIINQAKATLRFVTLPAKGGEPHTIVSGELKELEEFARFSPDGKYIAGFKTIEGNSDIFIWSVEGGEEVRVTSHPAEDLFPFWSPDGKYIVFLSDRAKSEDLWTIPMDGPHPVGAPERIKRNLGKNTIPVDLTPGGKLTMYVYSSGETPHDLLVLSVDPATGEARGQFQPFAKYPTQHFLLRWSPDGTRIAYASRKGNIQLPNIFVSSGNEKEDLEIPVGNYYVFNVEWARDGKHLIFPGILQPDGHLGIFRVSLEDYKIESLHLGERQGSSFSGAFINLWWLPRAEKFFFEKLVGANEREFYTMDREGKNVQRVADKVPTNYWTWPSPDGRHVAYRNGQNLELLSLLDKSSATLAHFPEGVQVVGLAWSPDGQSAAWNDGKKLNMYSIVEGAVRTLVEGDESQMISGMGWSWTPNLAWSPDGRKIAYVLQEASDEPEARSALWVIPATGGAPKKIVEAPSSHPVIDSVIWHSDGKMIFATGLPGKKPSIRYEHWVLENFLPKPKDKK
jgi:Tol biopolymer transport system component